MFCLDLSNIWGQASLPDLLALEPELNQAHRRLLGLEEEGTAPAWLEKTCGRAGKRKERSLPVPVRSVSNRKSAWCWRPRGCAWVLRG